MRKINEIFYSLQGEGRLTGTPAVFIRFSGCNKSCYFCDTDHENGIEMTDEEIFRRVNEFPAEWIILTGGEPALWIDKSFIENLKFITGKRIAIETNGSVQLPERLDWITVSPKSGMDGVGEYEIKVRMADELKVVDVGQPLDDYFKLPCVTSCTIMSLQPCHDNNSEINTKNINKTIKRVLEDPRWHLSLQTHRFLGIR